MGYSNMLKMRIGPSEVTVRGMPGDNENPIAGEADRD